jgi:hypothetical protein
VACAALKEKASESGVRGLTYQEFPLVCAPLFWYNNSNEEKGDSYEDYG